MKRRGEFERVAHLAATFGAVGALPGIPVAIGDDAAVLAPSTSPLVWTIDAQVEGTHFRRDWLSWADVGWRSFMAAASDLAAMGAVPLAALSALALSNDVDDDAFDALASGQAAASSRVAAPIVGGNLARATETSVTTTLLGRAERPILRSGAREGEELWLAGDVGMAAAGLAALVAGNDAPQGADIDACVDAWRRPRARIESGLAMRTSASASVDVSDGLARDAWHVAEASSVALVFEEEALLARAPRALADAAEKLGRELLDVLLHGGEDYALLVTSASPIEGFDRIGSVQRGPAQVLLRGPAGDIRRIEPEGFDHFR